MTRFPELEVTLPENPDVGLLRTRVQKALLAAGENEAARLFLEESTPVLHDGGEVLRIAATFVAMPGLEATSGETPIVVSGLGAKPPHDFDVGSEAGNLAVIAWRSLQTTSGKQDVKQGDGPPATTAQHWMVSVDDDHCHEPMNVFLTRAASARWLVTSAVPLGTVEQNSATETWIPGFNLRDTRFERVLAQMLYLTKQPAPPTHSESPTCMERAG